MFLTVLVHIYWGRRRISFYLLGICIGDYWRIFFYNTLNAKHEHLKFIEFHIHKSMTFLTLKFLFWKSFISSANTLKKKMHKTILHGISLVPIVL